MTWLFNHKLLSLIIILGAAYWFGNPSGRFGIVREGLVVYNRIPIMLLDLYVAPNGKLYPEGDLADLSNVNYWFEQHFSPYLNEGTASVPLYIGQGFSGTEQIAISRDLIQKCRERRFEPSMSSSEAAVEKYNAQILAGKKAAILLKVTPRTN